MSPKSIAVLALIVVFVANSMFTFRFQRTTLGICRELFGHNDKKVQILMTPPWVGFLGWFHTALIVVVTGVLWLTYGWPFGLGALIYGFAGLAVVDVVSPLPTYRFCFKLIESELDKHASTDTSGEFTRLKAQVLATRSRCLIQHEAGPQFISLNRRLPVAQSRRISLEHMPQLVKCAAEIRTTLQHLCRWLFPGRQAANEAGLPKSPVSSTVVQP